MRSKAASGGDGSFAGLVRTNIGCELIFRCQYAAAMIVAIAGANPYGLLAYSAALVAGATEMWVLKTRWAPQTKLHASTVILVLGTVTSFVCAIGAPALIALFGIFWLASTLLGVVLSSPGWSLGEDRPYAMFYLMLQLLINMAFFGVFVYGELEPRFGGGKPPAVSIALAGSPETKSIGQGNPIYLIGKHDDRLIIEERPRSGSPTVHFVAASEVKLMSVPAPGLVQVYTHAMTLAYQAVADAFGLAQSVPKSSIPAPSSVGGSTPKQ